MNPFHLNMNYSDLLRERRKKQMKKASWSVVIGRVSTMRKYFANFSERIHDLRMKRVHGAAVAAHDDSPCAVKMTGGKKSAMQTSSRGAWAPLSPAARGQSAVDLILGICTALLITFAAALVLLHAEIYFAGSVQGASRVDDESVRLGWRKMTTLIGRTGRQGSRPPALAIATKELFNG